MLRRAKVDMCVKSWVDVSKPVTGNGYCAAVVEVEVDVLTGETQVLQADILYDAGKSLSPLIDIGCVGLVHIVRAERQALKAQTHQTQTITTHNTLSFIYLNQSLSFGFTERIPDTDKLVIFYFYDSNGSLRMRLERRLASLRCITDYSILVGALCGASHAHEAA